MFCLFDLRGWNTFDLLVCWSLIWCFTLLSFALLIFNLLVFYSLIFWSTWAETATTKRRGRNLVRKIISLLKIYINWRVGFIINHFDLSVVIPPPTPSIRKCSRLPMSLFSSNWFQNLKLIYKWLHCLSWIDRMFFPNYVKIAKVLSLWTCLVYMRTPD